MSSELAKLTDFELHTLNPTLTCFDSLSALATFFCLSVHVERRRGVKVHTTSQNTNSGGSGDAEDPQWFVRCRRGN